MSLFPDGLIEIFLRDNVCARCYGELAKQPAENRLWDAHCPACGTAWSGATIRRSTAEKRGQQALSELREVKGNMPDLFPNPNHGKTANQILSELGF
jgi:hypothetical protein